MRKILSGALFLCLLAGQTNISFGESKQFGPYDFTPEVNYYGNAGLYNSDLHFSQNGDSFVFKGKKNGKWYVIKDGQTVAGGYDNIYSLTYSPDGKSYAFKGKSGGKWHIVKDGKIVSDGYDSEDFDAVSSPSYSPDGKSFAFVGTKGTGLDRISYVIKDGEIASDGYFPIASLVFSQDWTSFAFVGGVDTIKDGKLVGDKRKVIIKDGKNISDKYYRAGSPAYSPDGKSFAYVAGNQYERGTYMIKDGQVVNYGDVRSPAFSGKSFFYIGKKDMHDALIKDGEIVDASYGDKQQMVYSPDGSSYAFRTEDLHNAIQSKIFKDGKLVSEGYKNAIFPAYSPDGKSFSYLGEKDGKWYLIKDGKSIGEGQPFTYSSDSKHIAYMHQEPGWKWYITVQSFDDDTKANTSMGVTSISPAKNSTPTTKAVNLKIITEKQRQSLERQISGFSIEKINQILSRTNAMLSRTDLTVRKRETFEDLKVILNNRLDELRPKLDAPAGKVICTELVRQGYLSKEIWHADEMFAKKYIPEGTLSVYHFWAKPLVRLMQSSRLVTEIVSPYGIAWANHMAYQMDIAQKDSWLGYHIFSTLLPIHEKIADFFFSGNNSTTVQIKASTATPSITEIVQLGILYLTLLLLVMLPMVLLYIGIVIIKSLYRTVKKFITSRQMVTGKIFKKRGSETIQ